ncbi:MAG: PEP-CTERM sorting domain-containing protein [Bryobacteraceae bacterium]|jgi:hypothetical protein
MTRSRSLTRAALALAACVCAGTARAGTVAVDFGGYGGGGFNYTQGSYLQGFAFQANTPITIAALGFYDSNANGQAETFDNAPVGVYDLTTNTLLGSTTVTASDPLTGFFLYASLSNSIAINTTDTYAIAGITGANYYSADVPAASALIEVNPAIDYLSPAYATSNGFTQSFTLAEPGYFPQGSEWFGDFGPDFEFTTSGPGASTPEPGTMALLGGGLLGLAGIVRRRIRKNL